MDNTMTTIKRHYFWYTLACAALGACASGGVPQRWDTTGDDAGWPERVIGIELCNDAFSDQRCKAWYRAGTDPVAGPMYFLLAQGGDACSVSAPLFTMAIMGDNFTCRWRHPRL